MDTLIIIKELLLNKEIMGLFLFTFLVLFLITKDYYSTIKVLRRALIVYAILNIIFLK